MWTQLNRSALLAAALLLSAAGLALAIVTEPTRVIIEQYSFAFTVPAGCQVSYEEGGVGLSASHLPEGATRSDFGMLVYGSEAMLLGAAEAAAAGVALEHPEDDSALVYARDIKSAPDWAEKFAAIMAERGRTLGGEATVKSPGGSVKVPYFTWEQQAGFKVHHALMYVVDHGDSFIFVQVESNRPLSDAERGWVTSKLELLPPAPTAPAPAAQ